MNIRQLIEKIFDKWPAKVVCFILAVFLYFFHQLSLVEKRSFVVPLHVSENGMVSHEKGIPSSVTVIVRANIENINSILSSDITAWVDLDSYSESGTFDIPVELKLAEKLLTIDPLELHVNPEYVTAHVDIKKSRFVKIQPSVVGEVAHGYEIANIEVNPSYAQVVGAESIVNKLEAIETTKVMVSNASTDFSAEAEYLSVNKLLSVVDKGPYKVTVTVRPAETEKTYDNVSILPLHLSKSLKLKQSLPYVTFKVKGKLLNIEKYSPPLDCVRIDFSNITEPGVYDLPLIYTIPSSFTMMEKSDDSVTVELLESEIKKEEIPAAQSEENQLLTLQGRATYPDACVATKGYVRCVNPAKERYLERLCRGSFISMAFFGSVEDAEEKGIDGKAGGLL